MVMVMREPFNRLLIARKSPANQCNADDGTVLFVRARAEMPDRDVSHHFLSTADGRTRSKYGWVAVVEPFTREGFCATYLAGLILSDADAEHLDVMLNSIAKLTPGTPVAAAYSRRGVERPHGEFVVHRVFFHQGREPNR